MFSLERRTLRYHWLASQPFTKKRQECAGTGKKWAVERKSMFIKGQGERASGRSVAAPRKTRQKRTESHRKRTKFTRKRTVFGGNGQGFTGIRA